MEEKQTAKIYKICDNNDTKRYIGSTTEKYLSNRMGGHRKAYHRWKAGKVPKVRSYEIFEEFGLDNCHIVLLEELDFVSRDQLRAREAHYIQTLECVNKNLPSRTKQQWNEEHPNYYRDYYEQNKERLCATKSCECGGEYSIVTKAQHFRTKMHKYFIETGKQKYPIYAHLMKTYPIKQ